VALGKRGVAAPQRREDEPELDPDFRRVIRPEARPKHESSEDTMLEHYLTIDPRADFAKCLPLKPTSQ
jgi:hypothetical protein